MTRYPFLLLALITLSLTQFVEAKVVTVKHGRKSTQQQKKPTTFKVSTTSKTLPILVGSTNLANDLAKIRNQTRAHYFASSPLSSNVNGLVETVLWDDALKEKSSDKTTSDVFSTAATFLPKYLTPKLIHESAFFFGKGVTLYTAVIASIEQEELKTSVHDIAFVFNQLPFFDVTTGKCAIPFGAGSSFPVQSSLVSKLGCTKTVPTLILSRTIQEFTIKLFGFIDRASSDNSDAQKIYGIDIQKAIKINTADLTGGISYVSQSTPTSNDQAGSVNIYTKGSLGNFKVQVEYYLGIPSQIYSTLNPFQSEKKKQKRALKEYDIPNAFNVELGGSTTIQSYPVSLRGSYSFGQTSKTASYLHALNAKQQYTIACKVDITKHSKLELQYVYQPDSKTSEKNILKASTPRNILTLQAKYAFNS